MLRRPKDRPVGYVEHILRDFVPFARFVLVNDADEQIILLLSPGDPLFVEYQIQVLKM